MTYALTITVQRPFDEALGAVREGLAAQGFGILTEIDMSATLKKKLGVDVSPQVILGACNPPLAYRALQAEDSVGLLLPCNVVVRAIGENASVVEAADPQMMVGITGNDQLGPVASEAGVRLRAALDSLR